MGYHFKIFSLLIFIFIIISFYCTHLLTLNADDYFMESSGSLRYIEKISGKDENEVKQNFFLEKFRFVVRLRSIHKGKSEYQFGSFSPSPSPAPSIREAPTPLPGLPWIHKHTHKSKHHHNLMPKAQRVEEKDRGKAAKLIAAGVVSGAVVFLLCAAGIFWSCQRFKKQRKLKGKSKYATSSLNSVKKISSDPGPDLFYLDSIGVALESEPLRIQENVEIVCSKNQNEREDLVVEATENQESEIDDDGCVGEIVCVVEAKNYGSENQHIEGVDERTIDKVHVCEIEDDDESFHSFSDSASAKIRLSNASAGSYYSDNAEIHSPKMSRFSDGSSPQRSFRELDSVSIQVSGQESDIQSEKRIIPHPPSPPPLISTLSGGGGGVSSPQTVSGGGRDIPPPPTLSGGGSGIPPPPTLSGGGGGIPPPPCPPPISSGKPYSAKGTVPSPPPQFSQHTAFGRDGEPLTKLKPLHWDKVRAAPDRSTVWDKLRSSSFEFDEEMIKSLFGYNLQNTLKNDEMKSKTPSPNKHVLEPKRLQNITILSKALNMTSEQVCDALIKGNGLALQELEALAKMVPTKEEEAKLSSYKGDIEELGSAEKLVKTMVKIPFAFSRIEAMLYRETFDDEVIHLRKSFSMLEEACKELRSSRLFLKLLEAVLKTGNRMNIGTIRGGARAFKLDALLKLSDVKATDAKTTLLHFVVQEIIRSEGFRVSESIMGKINQKTNKKSQTIQDKEEEYKKMGLELVSGLGTELCNVKKTATLDLDVLATSVSNLSEGMRKMHKLVHKDISPVEKDGNFVHAFTTFLTYAERNLKELQDDENRVFMQVREITEYFHGDVSKEESNPLRIFVIVRDFLCMLDHVCKELRSLKTPATPNPLAPFR